MTGSLARGFDEFCASTALTAACTADDQVIVFLLRGLCLSQQHEGKTVRRWFWTPTTVCAAIPHLHVLYELSRQKKVVLIRCHCWKLQNQPFCSLWAIWCCLHPLNRAFYLHLIGFLLGATKRERNLTLKISVHYCISLYKPKRCTARCKWQYTPAAEKFEFLYDGI